MFHKKRSTCSFRIYLDEKENKKTCELELKASSLFAFRKAVENRDLDCFNKLCVLHYSKILEWLVDSPFTPPLLGWRREFVFPLKELIAPQVKIRSHKRFPDPDHPLIHPPTTILIQQPGYGFVNLTILKSTFQASCLYQLNQLLIHSRFINHLLEMLITLLLLCLV